MRKILPILCIILLFLLVACDNVNSPPMDTNGNTTNQQTDKPITDNTPTTDTPTTDDTPSTDDTPTVCTHSFGEWVTVSTATCEKEGIKERSCSKCNTKQTDTINKLEHTVVIDSAKEATCQESGKTEGRHCSVCNAVLVEQEAVNKKEHTIVIDSAVEASCTQTGLTEGSHCSVCKTTIIQQVIVNKKEHSIIIDNAVNATCSQNGLTEGAHCQICGTVTIKQEEVPASHKWKEATCEMPKQCTICYQTEGNALGHNLNNGKCSKCDFAVTINISYFTSNAFIKDSRASADIMLSRNSIKYGSDGTANITYTYISTITYVSNTGIGNPSLSYAVNLYKKDSSGEYILCDQQKVIVMDCYNGKRKESSVMFEGLTSGDYKIVVEND